MAAEVEVEGGHGHGPHDDRVEEHLERYRESDLGERGQRQGQWLRTATHADLTTLMPDVQPGGADGPYPYVAPRYWAAFAYTGA